MSDDVFLQDYGTHVTAMDLSSNMIALALERALEFTDVMVSLSPAQFARRQCRIYKCSGRRGSYLQIFFVTVCRCWL